ncbi:TonB-dependent receptor plug domain-containing protein, partial [Sulfurovum sp.]|uniref:TonB-dependent receptor plug domain-containing protein n=1 Tax=Sulfurovum sp. TaxID=1969726 RepID=UPI00356149A5
ASAGVINIITKEAKNGIHGSIGLNYGSHATKGADLTLSFRDEKLTAQVLASYLDTDGFSAIAPRDAESDGYTNKNLNLKLGYAFNTNNKLSLSYNKVDSDMDYDVGSPDDHISKIDAKQDNILFKYAFTLDNYSATILASRGKYDREATDPYGGLSTFDTIIKEYSFINAYDYDLGKAILGFEYKDINGDNQYHSIGYNSISQADYLNKAVYLSNIYDITENTLLETNLRFDDYSKFDNKTTYKIGLKHNHNFLKGFTTSANYYTSSDAPSAYQYANPVFGNILKPSYTKGFDISASYKDLLSVTYFKNTVEDYIDYDNTNYGYYNVNGTSKFSGIELESTYTLPDHNLIMSANYTHLFDYDDENGEIRERRAEDTFNASVSYYTENDIYFGIDAQYIGDRIEYSYNTYNIKARTGNYTLWNLNFSTQIMKDIDLSIHAKNIFDKEYQSVYSYATEDRSLYAKIKYSF